jgi:hypothetical protein
VAATSIRLAEFERDLLRQADRTLKAAQETLAAAEANWEEVVGAVLVMNELDIDKMQSMVLQKDFKFLVYEEKQDGTPIHQDRRPE